MRPCLLRGSPWILAVLTAAGCVSNAEATTSEHPIPRHYVCHRPQVPPRIDGELDDEAWNRAAWSSDFVDIEGDARPRPYFRTRMKMLWDDHHLYIAAELEEPHLQGSLDTRDSVIYHDNDFEVFLDPTGDGRDYLELEVNALGTVWDLRLDRPYHEGGRPDTSWDIAGLRCQVRCDGTINHAADRDAGWTVEIAIPWRALEGHTAHPGAPRDGERWRINFSRVQWLWDVRDNRYVKRRGADGERLPEHNWVWSPQGVISMHIPEHWGWVRFAKEPAARHRP